MSCEHPSGKYSVEVQWNGSSELELTATHATWKGHRVELGSPGALLRETEDGYRLEVDVFVVEQTTEWLPGQQGVREQLKLDFPPGPMPQGQGVFQREGEGPLPCEATWQDKAPSDAADGPEPGEAVQAGGEPGAGEFDWSSLLGPTLLKAPGEAPVGSACLAGKVVGLYFSAHWCPPCRGFTPRLADRYRELQAAGHAIEIVFVSSDRSERSFDEYFGEMPWLALPYENDVGEELSDKFEVAGIPTLVLIDASGKTISTGGRSVIMRDPASWLQSPSQSSGSAGMPAAGPSPGTEAAQKAKVIFDHFDRNKDGRLSLQEFIALVKATNPTQEIVESQIAAPLQRIFVRYDQYVNDDGISLEGMIKTYESLGGSLDEDFAKLGLTLGSAGGKYVVAWHVMDHAEGATFDSLGAARQEYDSRNGGMWAQRLYDADGTILAEYGAMARSDWDMLDAWRAASAGPAVPNNVTPVPTGSAAPAKFDWKTLVGDNLLNGSDSLQPRDYLNKAECLDGKVVGLYFSAHWCPPCRGFTPKLATRYNELKAAGHAFEIVFVSSDRDEESFAAYFGDMPWLALQLGCDQIEELSDKYEVSGIPTLVLIDAQGKTISKDGRSLVMQDPASWMSSTPAPAATGPPATGPSPGTEAAQKAKAIFDHFDRNKDGRLSLDEFAALVKATNPGITITRLMHIGAMLPEMFERYYQYVNDDGISLEGMIKTYENEGGSLNDDFAMLGLTLGPSADTETAQKAKQIFELFDSNKDGRLSLAEIVHLAKATATPEQQAVSDSDWEAAYRAMFEKYDQYVDEGGLSLEGLIKTYESEGGSLNEDFAMLRLTLGV